MKLIKQKVERNGEQYNDLNLVWQYKNKVYVVRVRPCFGRDNDKLMAIAQPVPSDEPIEKYL